MQGGPAGRQNQGNTRGSREERFLCQFQFLVAESRVINFLLVAPSYDHLCFGPGDQGGSRRQPQKRNPFFNFPQWAGDSFYGNIIRARNSCLLAGGFHRNAQEQDGNLRRLL